MQMILNNDTIDNIDQDILLDISLFTEHDVTIMSMVVMKKSTIGIILSGW